MSIYNKPELKINIGCNTPSFCHKKINSVNFTSSHANRYLQANTKKYITKNPLNLKSSSNINPENNGINYNSHIIQNSNINKVMTSANMKNRRFEIDINKNNSPKARFNKSMGENTILFKNKQSTSQNNINNINYNINNAKQINNTKSKNSMNNINININISKKIISTYYNKTKDKKDIIVKKKSINSLNNSNSKENKNTNTNNNIKYHQINNKKEENYKKNNNDILFKNQSQINLSKPHNNDSYCVNYYSNNTNKMIPNNSLGYLSITSTNNNKNNTNININNNTSSNYINSEKYASNSYYTARDLIKQNNANSVNKIIKENKASQIAGKINVLQHSSNINSIQNYLKYLNIGQKNKNQNKKNSPLINKNKTHKLSSNNIIYIHNNTESNIYNNTYNYETQNTFSKKTYSKSKNTNNNISKDNKENISGLNERNKMNIETPEELHFFYIKLIQNGKHINFDK